MSTSEAAPPKYRRVRTPTVLQMETVECGAASLGIVLGYHGRHVPLEVLRVDCGVSRDGSKAGNMLRAARKHGLEAKGFRKEPAQLRDLPGPLIVFWNFNHFVVVEGFGPRGVYLNDPATGPRLVTHREFDESFTGVVLVLQPGADFQRGGSRSTFFQSLGKRLPGTRLALTFVVLAGLGLVVPGLLVPTFGRVFVDDVLIDGNRDWVRPLLGAMALTALMRALLTRLEQRYLGRLETRLALSMSSKFLWHVLRLPVSFFLQRSAADLGSRVSMNDRVARLLSGDLATNVLNAIVILFYGGLMMRYDARMCGVAVAAALASIVALRLVARRRSSESRRMLQDRAKLAGVAVGGLQQIETIKATGGESQFFARWSGFQAKVMNSEQRLAVSSQLLEALPPLLNALAHITILALGALRVMDGHLSMGKLVAFQSLAASFLGPVGDLVRLGGTLQEVEGDLGRLDDVLRHEEDPDFHEEKAAAAGPAARLAGQVELKNVTFGYSRLDPPVIEDLSLTLKPGRRVALVGGSGSGKSTVAKLIAGLYQPWSGEILLDGTPRGEVPREVLTSSLAMVDQDILLLDGTLRENITLWDESSPEATVIRAARDAEIHDDIAARAGAYDFHVEEGGRNFSGGQRQRIEIARALAQEPSILVLDEATSALDPITEQAVDRNLRRRGCTCIVVAHRLSTIRDCDEIVVLEHGKVVQRGTHEEMSAAGGPYADLIKAG